jgi:hypothetical protein
VSGSRHRLIARSGDPYAQREWAKILGAAGRVDEEAELLCLAATAFSLLANVNMPGEILDDLALLLTDHNRVKEAFEILGEFAENIGIGDRRDRFAVMLAERGRLDELRKAAAFYDQAAAYLTVLLAFRRPAEQLGRDAVSGDPCATEVLQLLDMGGNLRNAEALKRFGLRPDGQIALDADGKNSVSLSIDAIPPSHIQLAHFIAFGTF